MELKTTLMHVSFASVLFIASIDKFPENFSSLFLVLSVVKSQSLVGVLEPNNLLANPEKLLEGKLPGPEHLLTRDGAIYTALNNGDVVKIVGEKIEVLGKFGKLCCELEI